MGPWSPSVLSIQFLSTLVCDAASRIVVDILLPILSFLSFLVLIDTGACVTCMSSSFAASHGFSVGPVTARGLFSACGRRLNVVGVCSLVFSFGPMFTVRWPVVVIDGLQHPFLIGRDVLRYLGLAVFITGKALVCVMGKALVCVRCVVFVNHAVLCRPTTRLVGSACPPPLLRTWGMQFQCRNATPHRLLLSSCHRPHHPPCPLLTPLWPPWWGPLLRSRTRQRSRGPR